MVIWSAWAIAHRTRCLASPRLSSGKCPMMCCIHALASGPQLPRGSSTKGMRCPPTYLVCFSFSLLANRCWTETPSWAEAAQTETSTHVCPLLGSQYHRSSRALRSFASYSAAACSVFHEKPHSPNQRPRASESWSCLLRLRPPYWHVRACCPLSPSHCAAQCLPCVV